MRAAGGWRRAPVVTGVTDGSRRRVLAADGQQLKKLADCHHRGSRHGRFQVDEPAIEAVVGAKRREGFCRL